MGCFGVGIPRLVMLLLDRQRDGRGFWGSDAFNTFDAVLTDWERQACRDAAQRLQRDLQAAGMSVLMDLLARGLARQKPDELPRVLRQRIERPRAQRELPMAPRIGQLDHPHIHRLHRPRRRMP